MEIHLHPDQQAHLIELAASVGRSAGEIVQEGLALWEKQERERTLAEFRASLDRAEAFLANGQGRIITEQSMRDLANEIHQRGLARLAAEKNFPR